MSSSSRSRRQQTRLTFTPLPSSSPAAKGYHKQIQDRAAAVTLESSPAPTKRRKLQHNDSERDSGIPTPAASRQVSRQINVEEGSDGESEPVRSTQKRLSTQTKSRTRSRQQRLDFSNARDPDSFSPPMKLSSPSRPHSSTRAGMFGTQSKRRVVDISSDEDEIADHARGSLPQHQSEEDEEEELPSPRKLMSKRDAKKAGSQGKERADPIAVDSDSGDDNIVVSGGQGTIGVEREDEDDDMPTTLGTQRRQKRQKRQRRKSLDSFISSSPPRMIDSDDDLEIIEQPKKRKRNDASDDDDDEPVTPRRLKPRKQLSQREKEDLEEDLDFLEPSSDVESPRKKRDTQSLKKNARQSALDKLKRRRSKQVDVQENEVEEVLDSSDELYEEDEDRPAPVKSSQMFREDEYDQDFVEEEEDENPLGVPDGVPLEFTRYASMKPKELFKYAVEWFVQKKINPAFRMDDDIYNLTFRKLDDEVAGLAGSKFKSSAWTPEFTVALNARPEIAYEPIDRNEGANWMRDTCDACNRTNHPATYQIQFQGKPYHRETLEDVAGNDDDDSSSDNEDADDEPAYDAAGREVPPETKIYYVGKFCMSNAQTAHALQHWRYHLNEWVIQWLDKAGHNAPDKVVERDRWSIKKRGKYANKIVDELEQAKVVKKLYQEYKSNIDEARESKQGRYGGWD